MALRVRDGLSGIDSNPRCPHDLWAAAMAALKGRNRSLDAQNVDRLFSRDNRQVLPPDAILRSHLLPILRGTMTSSVLSASAGIVVSMQ